MSDHFNFSILCARALQHTSLSQIFVTSLPGSHAASQLLNADHRAGSGCEGAAILHTHFLRESYSYRNLSLGEQFHLDGKKT